MLSNILLKALGLLNIIFSNLFTIISYENKIQTKILGSERSSRYLRNIVETAKLTWMFSKEAVPH